MLFNVKKKKNEMSHLSARMRFFTLTDDEGRPKGYLFSKKTLKIRAIIALFGMFFVSLHVIL